jgi:hypothetical protein
VQSLTWSLDSVNGQLHIPATLTRGSTPVLTEYVTYCVPELEWTIYRREDPTASAKTRKPDHPAVSLVVVRMTLSQFTESTLVIK